MVNDSVSKKQAPRRDVVDIVKVGSWGQVEYRHQLSCGHTEVRKRIAPAKQMACTWCVVAAEKGRELEEIVKPQPTQQHIIDVADIIDAQSTDLVLEQSAAQIQAGLASALKVQPDQIDVVLEDNEGVLELSYAVVFLTSSDARRIARPSVETIIDIA